MKHLFAFLMIAVCFVACTKESSAPPPPPPPTLKVAYGNWVGRVSKSFFEITKNSPDSVCDALSMILKEKVSVLQPDSALLSYWNYAKLNSSTVKINGDTIFARFPRSINSVFGNSGDGDSLIGLFNKEKTYMEGVLLRSGSGSIKMATEFPFYLEYKQ